MVSVNSRHASLTFKIVEANKPFILTNDDLPDCEYVILADKSNSGTIYVCGDYGVVAGGFPLDAGDSVSLHTKNLNKTYVAGSVANDKLYVLYASGIGATSQTLEYVLDELRKLNAKVKC